MTEIILIKDRQALTTTLAIAEGTQNQHKTVIQLTRKYREDLDEFGGVAFEMRPFETHGGMQHREIALLNEPQATLLMTYMRNTDVVRQFKKRLVKAFYDMREQLLMEGGETKRIELNHTRGITNPHGLDVKYSLDLTKIVMRPTRTNLAVLQRLTGIPMDDILPDQADPGAVTDHVTRFIAAACTRVDDHRFITFKRFYENFRRWYAVEIDAGSYGLPSKIEVGKRLRDLGYPMPSPRTTSGQARIGGIQLTCEDDRG